MYSQNIFTSVNLGGNKPDRGNAIRENYLLSCADEQLDLLKGLEASSIFRAHSHTPIKSDPRRSKHFFSRDFF